MAGYDTSIRVNTKVDNSDLLKVQKAFDDIEKSAKRTKKNIEGDFSSLSDVVEDYATRLKYLRDKGFGVGDKNYDDLYVAWKNAVNAEKEYLANLDKMTEKGIADEAAKATKEKEKQAETQRKIEEAAEKNLQTENARLEKEIQLEAKLQAEAAEQARLKELKESAVVADERLVELLQRQAELKTYLRDLEKAGVTAGYAQYDDASNELQQINDEVVAIKKLQEGFKQLSESSKKCLKTIQSGVKKSNGLLSTMGSRLKGIALSLLVFNWITKGFNAMVSAMKEGFQNLAQYSTDYNTSMSAMKSQAAQLKNGLAAAFEPVANIIIPYITQLVSWLNTAMNALGQFLAALSGKAVYTKAKKQVVDYAKSLSVASKAAKGALASFDDIKVLDQGGSGGDSGGGGESTGAAAFETAEIESQITSFAERIKEALQSFKDSIANWFQGLDFDPLLDSLAQLQTACEPLIGYVYNGLLWLLENVLEPLGSWTIEEALPAVINMLAEAFSALDTVLTTLQPTFDYIWNEILTPMGEFSGKVFLWAIEQMMNLFQKMSQVFTEKGEKVNAILMAMGKRVELLWEVYFKPHIQFMMGMVGTFFDYISLIVGDVIDILAGVVEFVTGVFTGDWEKAWNGVKDIFKGIINLIIDIFEGAVNAIINGLNSISVDIPDWVPGVGGKHFGISLQTLSLPRLADGAVIQGGRPFAAILGDQRFGQTNIETPLSTMVEAFRQAVSDMGGLNNGYSGPVYLQIDGKTFAKLELPYFKGEERRIGVSLKTT